VPSRRIGIAFVIITVLAACGSAPGQDSPNGGERPLPPVAPSNTPETTAPPAAHADPLVDRILSRLEARRITDLVADLSWHQHYVTDDPKDAMTKRGRIWYQREEPSARFMIHLTRKVVGGRADALDEKHLFDGCWYIKVDAQERHVTRNEIRKPDERRDPFKLGEGPFPLPFGQRKADILREFDVTRIEPAAGDPPDTDHLKLVPRADTSTAQTYKFVHFWIAREGEEAGLPVQVQAGKRDGTGRLDTIITVTFKDARLNEAFSASVFRLDTPRGYQETVEPLQR
jgi:hypothetical protein